jgi:uncharacterized membrane protein YbjE (DUF340 family)
MEKKIKKIGDILLISSVFALGFAMLSAIVFQGITGMDTFEPLTFSSIGEYIILCTFISGVILAFLGSICLIILYLTSKLHKNNS